MAGRGTDIILGGNAEFMARLKLREMFMPEVVMSDDDEIAFEKKDGAAVPSTKCAPAHALRAHTQARRQPNHSNGCF